MVAGFTLASAEELVEADWGIIVECQGIDFESGGTLTIIASYLPDRQFKMHQFNIEEAKKLTPNESIIQKMANDSKPRLQRSSHEVRFLSIDFALRAAENHANWVLRREGASIVRAIDEFLSHNRDTHIPSAEYVARSILSSIYKLNCWLNVNRSRFKEVRIAMSEEDALQLGVDHSSSEQGLAVIGVKGAAQ